MGLHVAARPSHILPVRIGDSARTMQVSERLLAESVFVQGIRPPTVPPGTARLRVTAMSTHTPDDLRCALDAFRAVCAEAACPTLTPVS
jgi:7-keto-8-aminopelargonate synthetase-like enzyme